MDSNFGEANIKRKLKNYIYEKPTHKSQEYHSTQYSDAESKKAMIGTEGKYPQKRTEKSREKYDCPDQRDRSEPQDESEDEKWEKCRNNRSGNSSRETIIELCTSKPRTKENTDTSENDEYLRSILHEKRKDGLKSIICGTEYHNEYTYQKSQDNTRKQKNNKCFYLSANIWEREKCYDTDDESYDTAPKERKLIRCEPKNGATYCQSNQCFEEYFSPWHSDVISISKKYKEGAEQSDKCETEKREEYPLCTKSLSIRSENAGVREKFV